MSLRTIRSTLKLDPADGALGVEIEVEGARLPSELDSKYWRVDKDGSLKGESYEYVTPKPTSLEGIKEALDYLASRYKARGSIISDSVRAGVHVHRNVQELNAKQLYTFITAYLVLEDVLVKWCGDNREGNHFCLRSKDAEWLLFQLEKAITQRRLTPLKTENIRYGSLNCLALFKYGSLEFRAMRGTSDLDQIFNWAATIEDIYQSALTFDNPKEVVISMSGDGEEHFLKTVLPNTWKLYHKIPNYEQMIRSSARRVQMIAFTTDWDAWGAKSKNPFEDALPPLPVVPEQEHPELEGLQPALNLAAGEVLWGHQPAPQGLAIPPQPAPMWAVIDDPIIDNEFDEVNDGDF